MLILFVTILGENIFEPKNLTFINQKIKLLLEFTFSKEHNTGTGG